MNRLILKLESVHSIIPTCVYHPSLQYDFNSTSRTPENKSKTLKSLKKETKTQNTNTKSPEHEHEDLKTRTRRPQNTNTKTLEHENTRTRTRRPQNTKTTAQQQQNGCSKNCRASQLLKHVLTALCFPACETQIWKMLHEFYSSAMNVCWSAGGGFTFPINFSTVKDVIGGSPWLENGNTCKRKPPQAFTVRKSNNNHYFLL